MTLIDSLASLVRTHYVLDGPAQSIADRLVTRAADPTDPLADVDALAQTEPEEAAALLREALQEVHQDGHLRVRHRPEGALDDAADPAASEAFFAAECRANSGGVRSVQRLDEHTGLLEIAPYLSPATMAAPYVRAAFALLSGVAHLIIDVRDCRGADPLTVSLVCSHLLGEDRVHLQDMHTRGKPTEQYWTTPAAAEHLVPSDVTIHVLTSSGTFSGGEELAYNLQALGRATIVGETTGGGAHPREAFRLTDVLEAHVPVASSRNAVTGTNWEHVGVVPDIACPADEALARARQASEHVHWKPAQRHTGRGVAAVG